MLPHININPDQYLELEKLALGAFYPLKGFMNYKELVSVVDTCRLPSGAVFPLPVILDIDKEDLLLIKGAEVVNLKFNGEIVGQIKPNDFYECDRMSTAAKIYGTVDDIHPGVMSFYRLKPIFVGGDVVLTQRPKFNTAIQEMTPLETKAYFNKRGWKKIVGFQTRNVPHRAHEYLLRIALEYCDGLFIQPLVGKKRAGDFTPEAIYRGYKCLIEGFLPSDRVLMAALTTTMRYAGPREALFHAIVRRNYGCTHFIVGRDHAGVGGWYGIYDAQNLACKFSNEIGIEIMPLKGPYYCSKCLTIATESSCSHYETEFMTEVSGTDMRNILKKGARPNANLMRQEVVDSLLGCKCFIE